MVEQNKDKVSLDAVKWLRQVASPLHSRWEAEKAEKLYHGRKEARWDFGKEIHLFS